MDFENILKRLSTLGGSLSIGQKLSLALAFVAVVGLVVGSSYWLNKESYVYLFTDLEPASTSEVVSKLKSQKITPEIADGGRAVKVPARLIDELRLQFAASGMPTSGHVGFEIFDKVSFGQTEFMEQTNYKRALQGELARTISTLNEVSSASVQVALAKQSLFESKQTAAKASVVVKLKGNKTLAPANVQGIRALVAASVEGLKPEGVVVTDSYGRLLSKPADDGDIANAGPSLDKQNSMEKDLTTKLVGLLEPVVGTGRVRVNVALRLNALSEEQTEERWDPNAAVVRSRVTQSDQTQTAAGAAAVAGARANMPPDGPPKPDVPKPADLRLAGRNSETANYEISRSLKHTVRPSGEIARMTVAVILDDAPTSETAKDGKVTRSNKPRAKDQIQRVQNIVTAATGLDTSRGDTLVVENVSFSDRPASEEEIVPPTTLEKYSPQINDFGRMGVVLLLGAMAFFMVIRPVMKKALAVPTVAVAVAGPALPASIPTGPTIEDLEGQIEAELDAATAQNASRLKIPVLSKRVGGMTQKEPEHAARLVRAWLREDKR